MSIIKDIQQTLGTMPYGTATITIRRANGRNVQLTSHQVETIRFENNEEGLTFLAKFLKELIDTKYSGEVNFSVTMKEGNLQQMGYHSQKQVNY